MQEYSCCKVCDGKVIRINEKYNLGECTNCKLIFCLKTFTQQEFIEVYDALYNNEKTHYQRHSKDEFDKIVSGKSVKVGFNRSRLLKRIVLAKNCKSVLEIGSGVGLIGYYIRSKNDKISYTGVELDKEAFEKSRMINLNTIHGDFAAIEKIEGTFDVIMLWEVIEHLQDLKLFLELANKKLNVNGKIILSTPNYNKIYNYPNRHKDQLFQDAPPVHLNFFTPENIKNIFERNQFKNCRVMVKKFPYLQLSSSSFYLDCIKVIFKRFHGTTLYFVASKNRL